MAQSASRLIGGLKRPMDRPLPSPAAVRTELADEPPGGGQLVASLCHMSDLHVMDAASPMRFEWIETLADDPRWRPLLHMHRPQEALVPWAVAAHVDALRADPTSTTRRSVRSGHLHRRQHRQRATQRAGRVPGADRGWHLAAVADRWRPGRVRRRRRARCGRTGALGAMSSTPGSRVGIRSSTICSSVLRSHWCRRGSGCRGPAFRATTTSCARAPHWSTTT